MMNKSNVLIIVKHMTGLAGVAGVSALIGLPAHAQLKIAPNSLHAVTEQWRITNVDTVFPDFTAQTQDLPKEAPVVDVLPVSDPESASDLTAPTPVIPDDASIAPTADSPDDDASIAPIVDSPDDDAAIAPTADSPDDDIANVEDMPTSDSGSAVDLKRNTADTINEDTSAVEEIPASDTGSAADLMAPPLETPEAVEIPESSSITPSELQQFVNAVMEVQAIEQQTQENMAQLITAEGLSPERFNQIFLAQQSANADPISEITPEEQQTFDQVFSQLQAIDQASQVSKEQAVTDQGLAMERFSQILKAVRQDPDLQEQVQELLPPTE
ncbi:MAG: DUF4168 domain-containing protein [Leptolyngbyaceae cyanobacterium MO_188.B28]|nr:DUF4168 domain-containing protein [Leptolyngbyaceae cyanobacterium MO_188.B28]